LLGRLHPMNVETMISAVARNAATNRCISRGTYACRPEEVIGETV
jgi:hypothetical protein